MAHEIGVCKHGDPVSKLHTVHSVSLTYWIASCRVDYYIDITTRLLGTPSGLATRISPRSASRGELVVLFARISWFVCPLSPGLCGLLARDSAMLHIGPTHFTSIWKRSLSPELDLELCQLYKCSG